MPQAERLAEGDFVQIQRDRLFTTLPVGDAAAHRAVQPRPKQRIAATDGRQLVEAQVGIPRKQVADGRRPGVDQFLLIALEGDDDQVALTLEVAGQIEGAAVEIAGVEVGKQRRAVLVKLS